MTRTTITLSAEADRLVRAVMRERGISFKEAVNAAIVQGLTPQPSVAVRTPTRRLGRARLPLDRALALAGELEDEALLQKRELGK